MLETKINISRKFLRQIAEILLDEDPVESIQRYAKIFSGNC